MNEVMSPARPATVAALETVSILLLAGQIVMGGIDFGLGIILDVLWWGLLLWLALQVTRRGNGSARKVLTALIALGIISFLAALAYLGSSWQDATVEISAIPFGLPELVVGLALLGLTIAQTVLLWASPTTRWIEHHQAINGTA